MSKRSDGLARSVHVRLMRHAKELGVRFVREAQLAATLEDAHIVPVIDSGVDSELRVPFLVRGPGITPGSVCHTPVAGYDFLATFYDLAGGEGPLTEEVDGVSIRPLLTNPGAVLIDRPKNTLFFHRPSRRFSARLSSVS